MSTVAAAPTGKAAGLAGSLLAPPLAAVQFLTRIPVPAFAFDARTLPRAAAFFPLVGAALGAIAGFAYRLLAAHLPTTVAAIVATALLVALTGALHEDALADCADAFGLPRTRERMLAILHDSAIGSFGACALVLSLAARIACVASLPGARAVPVLIAALTLSRWAVLPLTLLPAATTGGRGSTLARQVSPGAFAFATIAAGTILFFTLGTASVAPALAAMFVITGSALYFQHRLGGTTGDCFGATVQLVEITVLLTAVFRGAWHA